MATKAENVKFLVSAGFPRNSLTGLTATEIQELVDVEKGIEETPDRETELRESLKGKVPAGILAKADLEMLEFLAARNSKESAPKESAPKIPAKPKVSAIESPVKLAIAEWLKAAKPAKAGTHPLPARTSKEAAAKGERWKPETVRAQITKAFENYGFEFANEWADLFVTGSLDSVEFLTVARAITVRKESAK